MNDKIKEHISEFTHKYILILFSYTLEMDKKSKTASKTVILIRMMKGEFQKDSND